MQYGGLKMNNQKYQYSYNINESANEEDFFVCCKLIEKNLPGVKKEKLLIDVDGSLIQIYHYANKKIVIFDDYYVDAVYINSNVKLDAIIGRKSIY